MRTSTKTILATVAFAAVHSALASRDAKRLAARLIGENAERGTYRTFFNAQSILTTLGLAWYVSRLGKKTIYRVPFPASWIMRVLQVTTPAYLAWGAATLGLKRVSGIEALTRWWRGEEVNPPAAQGPELGNDAWGPFRFSRHPLNLAPLPWLWLTPRMTTRRFAFNLAATAYLIAGSKHEETRLEGEYGDAYREYRERASFFWPRFMTAARDPSNATQPS